MNDHDSAQKRRAIDLKMRLFIVTATNELIDSELGGTGKQVEEGDHLSGKLRADLDRLLEEAPWIKDDEDYCAITGDGSDFPSLIAILKQYETAPDNPNCFSPDGEFVD